MAGWRELRVLLGYAGRLAGAGPWLLGALLLACATLAGSLGLLGLSGWFLSATAIAGLTPASAQAFNFFLPGAGVRFFALLRTASRWGERVVSHEATFRLIAGLRLWLYRRLARLSPSQLGRHHGSDLLNALVRDVDALDNLYPRLLLPLAAALLCFAVLALLVGQMAPVLVWLPLGLTAFALFVLPLAGWLAGRRPASAWVAGRAGLRRELLDCVDGLEDLALHQPAWQARRAAALASSRHWLKQQRSLQRRGAWLRALTVLLTGAAAWGALMLVARGGTAEAPGPWLAAVVLVLLGAHEALQALPGACLELPGTAAAAARLEGLASQMPRPAFATAGAQPPGNGLTVSGLAFAWPDQLPLFEGLSLSVAEGEHIALLGPSGGGKSTLVSLLARLEEADAGEIRLGGVELSELDESTLRARMSCAGQFSWAQAATLAENLRLAAPEADAERMMAVLRLVGLADMVSAWRDGLQTWVEEGGASLSGGQRRRLGLARALLREAPITLLDEPTEGLDPAAEAALVAAVRQHLRGRTLIWVTHRPAGLAAFDRVLRLEQGRLAELSPAAVRALD